MWLCDADGDADVIDAVDAGQVGTNRPRLRKNLIYSALIKCKQQQHESKSNVTVHKVSLSAEPGPGSLALAECVHSTGLLSFLERAWREWNLLVARGLADEYMGKNLDSRSVPDLSVFLPGQSAPRDHILTQSGGGSKFPTLSRPGQSIHSQICYYSMDRMTPIQADTLLDLASDLAVIQKSVELIQNWQADHNNPQAHAPPFIYALTSQPGHHATEESIGGYCYVNNAAVAAKLLQTQAKHNQVAVLESTHTLIQAIHSAPLRLQTSRCTPWNGLFGSSNLPAAPFHLCLAACYPRLFSTVFAWILVVIFLSSLDYHAGNVTSARKHSQAIFLFLLSLFRLSIIDCFGSTWAFCVSYADGLAVFLCRRGPWREYLPRP